MIDFLVIWAEQIIIALIIIVIIEMILPNSNKKYIKVIFGIFIIYIILSPIISSKSDEFINLIKNDIDSENITNLTNEENSIDIINGTFLETYESNIIYAIENSLDFYGYSIKVEDIEINNNNDILNLKIKILDENNEIAKGNIKDNINYNEKSNVRTVNQVEIDKIEIDNNNLLDDESALKTENEKNYSNNNNNREETINNEIINYISETFNIKKENIIIVRD